MPFQMYLILGDSKMYLNYFSTLNDKQYYYTYVFFTLNNLRNRLTFQRRLDVSF